MKSRRVLFYYDNYCGEHSHGGTEVATWRIASALRQHQDIGVYHAFLRKEPQGQEPPYDGTLRLQKGSNFVGTLGEFIRDNRIDAVVNMGRFFRHRKLRQAIDASGREVRLLFMHHFAPGSEWQKSTFSAGWHLLRLNPGNPLYWLRASLYPLLRLPRTIRLKRVYGDVYNMSDAVVLLSNGYKKEYKKIAGLPEESKFFAIPNIFDNGQSRDFKKEKRVLILSRMDEIQKRITLALEVWARIETNPQLADWHLDIVGSGHDSGAIRKKARRLGLKRVSFHGWQNPVKFLQSASIIISTSLYEGLPLSLIEARSFGCVPVAFDSYASLKDIITDHHDGIIVTPFGDHEKFATSLTQVMLDDNLRENLSSETGKSALRLSSERVASLWNRMLQNI